MRLWIDGTRVINSRRRLLWVGDIVEQIDVSNGPVDVGDLLVDLIDRIIWRKSDAIDNFEGEVMALKTTRLSGWW